MIGILVFVLLFAVTTKCSPAVQSCPCKIDKTTNTVDCSSRDPRLTAVPKCVPRNVRKLILSNNKFNKLQRRQFEDFNKLVYLDISDCFIEYLSEETFDGLHELETLLLTDNLIENLNTTNFIGVPKLRFLDLTSNHIKDIQECTFSELINLRNLSLGGNHLSYLKPQVFDGLSTLKQLDLHNNRLRYAISFPPDVFKPLSGLLEINIEGICHPDEVSNCTYIDTQLSVLSSLKILHMDGYPKQILGPGFRSLTNLEEIYLANLTEITELTLINIRNSPIRKLDFGLCYIYAIHKFSFSLLNNLSYLILSHNFKFCDEGIRNTTVGLNSTSIRYLDVSSTCQLSWALSPPTIKGLQQTKLQVLDLSMSCIVFINPAVFEYLPKTLKYLDLHGNRLSMIDLTFLSILENLQALYISYQTGESSALELNLKHPHRVAVSGSTLNETKHYTNDVSKLEILKDINDFGESQPKDQLVGRHLPNSEPDHDVGIDCFGDMPISLHTIDLSNSGLLSGPIGGVVEIFCGSNNTLKNLDASNQKPSKDNEKFYFNALLTRLKNLRKLETLDLSGNRLKDFHVNTFSKLTQLKRLSLNINSLVDVKFDIQRLYNLNVLDLSDNRISYLDDTFTKDIEIISKRSNLTVYLHGNKLACDCNHLKFVSWLKNTNVIFRKDNLTCVYKNGSELGLSDIVNIHRVLEAECIAVTVLVSCIFVFVVENLILGSIAVLLDRRWRFKYLSLVGKKAINPYHPIEDREIALEYDMYISYAYDHMLTPTQTLHELVAQGIHPCLKRRGFNVIIREELDVGRKLYDVISQVLRRSRKVIVFMSNDYCKDHWNVFEFNMAAMEGIYTKREVIVPIVVENLNPKDLHEEVYAYLRSGPVAKFTAETTFRGLIEYLTESVK